MDLPCIIRSNQRKARTRNGRSIRNNQRIFRRLRRYTFSTSAVFLCKYLNTLLCPFVWQSHYQPPTDYSPYPNHPPNDPYAIHERPPPADPYYRSYGRDGYNAPPRGYGTLGPYREHDGFADRNGPMARLYPADNRPAELPGRDSHASYVAPLPPPLPHALGPARAAVSEASEPGSGFSTGSDVSAGVARPGSDSFFAQEPNTVPLPPFDGLPRAELPAVAPSAVSAPPVVAPVLPDLRSLKLETASAQELEALVQGLQSILALRKQAPPPSSSGPQSMPLPQMTTTISLPQSASQYHAPYSQDTYVSQQQQPDQQQQQQYDYRPQPPPILSQHQFHQRQQPPYSAAQDLPHQPPQQQHAQQSSSRFAPGPAHPALLSSVPKNIVPEDLHAHFDHAENLRLEGKLSEARDAFEHLLALTVAVHGSNHPKVADALNGLAQVLIGVGDFPLALVMAERALKINEPAEVHSQCRYAFILRWVGYFSILRSLFFCS